MRHSVTEFSVRARMTAWESIRKTVGCILRPSKRLVASSTVVRVTSPSEQLRCTYGGVPLKYPQKYLAPVFPDLVWDEPSVSTCSHFGSGSSVSSLRAIASVALFVEHFS